MGKDIINFLKLCASRAITKIGGGDRGIDFATLHSPCLIRVAHRHTPSAFQLRVEPSCRVRIPKSTKQTKKNAPTGHFVICGGDRGIRTLDTVACIRDFESRAFNQLCHISETRVHYIYLVCKKQRFNFLFLLVKKLWTDYHYFF